jgi:SAM-dependent methyltransferase
MDRKTHWEDVYTRRAETEVSWFQPEPALSLALIRAACPAGGRVIDVGGGASVLVDRLLDAGFERPAVLDVSGAALARSRARLGPDGAARVEWVEADVTAAADVGTFDLWHDRAVFHFLTAPDDRRAYVGLATRTVRPRGHLVLATFAADGGPTRCSAASTCASTTRRRLPPNWGRASAWSRRRARRTRRPAARPRSSSTACLNEPNEKPARPRVGPTARGTALLKEKPCGR